MKPAAPVTRIFTVAFLLFLVRAFGFKNFPERFCNDDQVKPYRPSVDIKHVHVNPLLVRGRLPSHYLPKTRQSGRKGKQLGQQRPVALSFLRRNHARPDKGELAGKDAEKLWELVHAEASHQSSDA